MSQTKSIFYFIGAQHSKGKLQKTGKRPLRRELLVEQQPAQERKIRSHLARRKSENLFKFVSINLRFDLNLDWFIIL